MRKELLDEAFNAGWDSHQRAMERATQAQADRAMGDALLAHLIEVAHRNPDGSVSAQYLEYIKTDWLAAAWQRAKTK